MVDFHSPSQFGVVGARIHEPGMRIVSALDVARRGDVACRIDHSVSSHSAHLPQPTFLQSSTVTTTNQPAPAPCASGAGRTRLHSDRPVRVRGIEEVSDGRPEWIETALRLGNPPHAANGITVTIAALVVGADATSWIYHNEIFFLASLPIGVMSYVALVTNTLATIALYVLGRRSHADGHESPSLLSSRQEGSKGK